MGKRVADMTPEEVERQRVSARARYAANPEKHRANAAARRAADPEKHRADNAAWRAANPEKYRANARARYAANPEKVKAKNAAWRAADPERNRAACAAYRAADPEKARAREAAYRAANRDRRNARQRERYAEKRRQQIASQIPIMTAEGVMRLAPVRRRKTHLYVITCEPTGWLYVGLTKRDPAARFREHMRGNSGVRVRDALTKFTRDDFTFEVLHTYANPSEAARAEKALIAHLDLTGPNGMNTGRGGEGARRKKWIIEPIQEGDDGEDC
jgi:hypothetical protein